MRRAETCLILLVATLAGGEAPALERIGNDPVVAGEVVEWILRGPDPPSLDVAANPRLLVEDAAGDGVVLGSFAHRPCVRRDDGRIDFAGPLELRVRHRFPAPGAYRLTLVAPDGEAVLAEASIRAGAARRPPGPPIICPTNPLLLARRDGVPFIPIGVNLCWATGDDPLGAYLRMLQAFADNGGTHVRLWTCSWFGQVEGDAPDAYRLDQAWLVDRILAAARDRGVDVTLVIDNFHDIVLGKGCPYGATLEERLGRLFRNPLAPAYARRLRYLAARWGAFDNLLAWEYCNEVDLTGVDRAATRAWIEAVATHLDEVDPYRHLRTLSLSDQDWARVAASPGLDLTQIHHYVPYLTQASEWDQDGYAPLLRHQLWALEVGKPFCFAEIGHQGTNEDNPGNEADATGLLLRQQAWGALLVGAYGTGMNWWWDVYIDRRHLWPAFAPIAATLARIDWSDPGLRPYRPPARAELRLIGWQSQDQMLLRAVPWHDTWYSEAVEGRRPGTAELRRRVALVTGLRPAATFDLWGIDAATGEDLRREELRSDPAGRLVIDLDRDHARELIILRRREPERPPAP